MDDENIVWDDSIEMLLQKYADESIVRENMHRQSYYKFKSLTTAFQLPVIILSALSGSVTFLSKGYKSVEEILMNITGSVSILVSIISAVASYLKLGEQQTKHQVSEIAWQDFFNSVKHELSLRRDLRVPAHEFLRKVKTDYARLFEISPIVSQKIINRVRSKLKSVDHDTFNVPNYLNGFSHTPVYQIGD